MLLAPSHPPMTSLPRLVVPLIAFCVIGAACAGVHGQARQTFQQSTLNATWYGAYHRPLPPNSGSTAVATRTDRNRGAQNDRRAPTQDPASEVTAIPDSVAHHYEAQHAAAYVRDVYALNETEVGEGAGVEVVDIYRWTQEHGTIYHSPRPAVGDLAFFHNTHDVNSDGRPNDWFTHVGIVESVDDADTVTVLSFVDDSVGRLYLNRARPDIERDGRSLLNTPMRQRHRSDPAHTEHLAGQLFAGFGSLLGERTQVVVLDQWSPRESPSLHASR